MFLQFPEPALGRTRSARKNSVRVTEFFGTGLNEQQKLLIVEQRGCTWVLVASIPQPLEAVLVVAVDDFGVGRTAEAGQGSNLSRSASFREERNGLSAPLLHSATAVPIVLPEFSRGVMRGECQRRFDASMLANFSQSVSTGTFSTGEGRRSMLR